jgi:hypothetical protein
MRPKRWHLAVVATAMLALAATELPARVAERPEATPANPSPRVAALQHDPQFILETVARRMSITLRPDLPPPAIRLESRTPLERLQAAAARQWGFRPHVFTTTYASAGNEIFLIDDPVLYARYGGTPDDSLAHELVHYLQARYRRDDFSSDWSESEAVAIQTWFRRQYMEPRHAAAAATGGPR